MIRQHNAGNGDEVRQPEESLAQDPDPPWAAGMLGGPMRQVAGVGRFPNGNRKTRNRRVHVAADSGEFASIPEAEVVDCQRKA